MIKVYTGARKSLPVVEVLFPNLGKADEPNIFGEVIFKGFNEPIVSLVDKPEDADYLLIPHNYKYVKVDRAYLDEFVDLSERLGKKIIVFLIGDSDEDVPLQNSIVFRNSQYRYKKKGNEIMVPGYAVDLGALYGVEKRPKGKRPVVGFCGWASHGSLREAVGSWVKNMKAQLRTLLGDKNASLHKKGLYFRKKAIATLRSDDRVDTNFIIRSSYGGHQATIGLKPEFARKEYVANMKQSDFVLAPKGDGNFSVRFYEALSLGRIPLLVDTGCPLPLEGVINYDSFVLRVDAREVAKVGAAVVAFYATLNAKAYEEMQERARDAFEKYLKIDVFYRHVLTDEFLSRHAQ